MAENKKTPSVREKENEKRLRKLVNSNFRKKMYRVKTMRKGETLSVEINPVKI